MLCKYGIKYFTFTEHSFKIILLYAWQTKLARSTTIHVGLLCYGYAMAALFNNLMFCHCHFWPPQSWSQSFLAKSDLVPVFQGWVRFGDQILVTALAMLLLASSTQLLLLTLLSSDLIVVSRGLGCCSTVLSGLDLEEETVRPALLQLVERETEGLSDPLPRIIKLGSLHDIISQLVRNMVEGANIAVRAPRLERIIKRGRETEGSWAPAGAGTELLKPFFFGRGRAKSIRTSERGFLLDRIFKRTQSLQDGKYEGESQIVQPAILVHLRPRRSSSK